MCAVEQKVTQGRYLITRYGRKTDAAVAVLMEAFFGGQLLEGVTK